MNEKAITIKEQKKIMLGILSDFSEYCKDHDLTYFLDAGTLIGAVRHKGFIPWDDDIDVNMPREDYDKFIALTKESDGMLNNHLKVEYPEETLHVFLKIGDTRTVLVEYPDKFPMKCAVYIDIFPKDGLRDKSWRTKILCSLSKTLALVNWFCKFSIYVWKNDSHIVKRFIAFVGRKGIKHPNLAIEVQDKLIHWYKKRNPIEQCSYVTTLVNGEYHKIAPKTCFDEVIDMKFEGKTFDGPIGYDEYLHCLYEGDYMQLPPEDQRIPHKTIVYWKEGYKP